MQKGQTLVEVVLAIALATIVIIGLLSTVLGSLSNAESSQAQNEATQYSQQGMEVLRSMNKDLGNNQTYCFDENNNLDINLSDCNNTPNVNQRYIRTVKVDIDNTKCSAQLSHVTVTTSWQDGKCQGGSYCKNVSLESCFSNI